jgi:hypothetical protein
VITFEVEVVDTSVEVNVESPNISVQVNALPTVIYAATPGPPGVRGPAGNGAQIVGEAPTGLRNGINIVFGTANGYVAASPAVHVNGLRERLDIDYTESGAQQITFTIPPLSDDDVVIDYEIS